MPSVSHLRPALVRTRRQAKRNARRAYSALTIPLAAANRSAASPRRRGPGNAVTVLAAGVVAPSGTCSSNVSAGTAADHRLGRGIISRRMAASTTSAELAERLLGGDKRALARAISLIENGDEAGAKLVAELYPRTGSARIVGFTGPPGVGKSTIIGSLVKELRGHDRRVSVLSIDPSSPFTRGALLGDRIRLSEHFLDDGVFIRSMASRGALGGLAEATLQTALVMDAAGFDDVLLETVGVGQAEIDVVDHADTVVLALMPGSGDSIQALKAGVMEIPDVIVVNKAEHPLTDTMVREVRTALSLGPAGDWKVPVVKTVASEGRGIPDLLAAIEEHRAHVEKTGTLAERRARNLRSEVLGLAAARMRRELEQRIAEDPEVASLLASVVRRETDPATAARRLLERERRDG
jgi:GTPase